MEEHTNQENQHLNNKRPPRKSGYFISGLGGVIAGAVALTLILPHVENASSQAASTSQSTSVNASPVSNVLKNTSSVNVSTDITKAVSKMNKAVVGVENLQAQSAEDWTQSQYGQDQNQNQSQSQDQLESSGSGVIYKKANGKAYVVTNNHVVNGADQLEVTLSDGSKVKGKLLGSDVWTDLAVIEIDGSKVSTVAQFGNSNSLKLGEPVVAIGNPLGEEFSGSVTEGIISGVNRTVPVDLNEDGKDDWQQEVIQTDAAINPGNSGGALVNAAGQVIGINSMKVAQDSVEGIGFAIPINSVKPIISQLEKNGKVSRPTIGVTLEDVSDIPAYYQQQDLRLPSNVKDGIMIDSVVQNSPAEKAGLKKLDVIVKLDGQKVSNIIQLRKYLYEHKKPGDNVKVTFYHDGKEQEATVHLTNESSL